MLYHNSSSQYHSKNERSNYKIPCSLRRREIYPLVLIVIIVVVGIVVAIVDIMIVEFCGNRGCTGHLRTYFSGSPLSRCDEICHARHYPVGSIKLCCDVPQVPSQRRQPLSPATLSRFDSCSYTILFLLRNGRCPRSPNKREET